MCECVQLRVVSFCVAQYMYVVIEIIKELMKI